MANRINFEAVDEMLRDILGNELPFGGITVVLGGDFRQTLPVIVGGSRAETVTSSLKKFNLWEQIKVLKLQRNVRLSSANETYPKFLLDVGEGNLSEEIIFPDEMAVLNLDSLIEFTYQNFENQCLDLSYLLERSILTSKNAVVDRVNQKILGMLPNESYSYSSADTLIQSDGLNSSLYPPEFLNNLDWNGCPLIC